LIFSWEFLHGWNWDRKIVELMSLFSPKMRPLVRK